MGSYGNSSEGFFGFYLQKIRNVKIRTLWDYMKNFTDIRYGARIQQLMDEFHLSYKRIEQIVREEQG